jgi:hypothetical protein
MRHVVDIRLRAIPQDRRRGAVRGLARQSSLAMAIALATGWVAVVAMGTIPALGATSQPTPLTLTPGPATFGDVEAGATSEQTITATNPAPEQPGVEVCGNDVDEHQDGAVDETSDCVSDGVDVAETCCADSLLLLSEVEIYTVQLTGSDAFAEVEDRCEGVALAPGESCDVRVTFMPTEAGEFAASLEYATSTGTVSAALSGLGISSDPTTTTSATTPTSASPTPAPSSPPTSQAPPTTPTSVETAPPPGDPASPPPTAAVADRGGRGLWWPVAAALTLLAAVVLAAPRVWARRGPKWVRAHVQAVARPGVDRDAAIVRSPAGRSSPTCVVRLEPHADRGTQALLEVDR